MGDNVAGILVLALLLAVIALMGRAIIVSNTLMDITRRAAFERAEARAKTNFTITTTTASGTNITVAIKNTGETPIADLKAMDFIVEYTSTAGGGTKVITWLNYTTGTLAADEWKKTSISPDNLEQNVWNERETLTLDALLSGTLQSATKGTVSIATPAGVSGTAFFTVP